ncbi:MAG TPA: hypothetical protein PLE92_11685, partial [Lentisphaeria bacterium]|nr:hypothetical protein [Lentisphaeria bacterium]
LPLSSYFTDKKHNPWSYLCNSQSQNLPSAGKTIKTCAKTRIIRKDGLYLSQSRSEKPQPEFLLRDCSEMLKFPQKRAYASQPRGMTEMASIHQQELVK